jgi:response regulator NasT
MLRVLLVNDTNKQVGSLRTALVQAGCEVVEEVSSALMIPKRVAELKADIVIIDTESPSRDVLEQICVMTQDAPHPIVMVSEDTQPAAIKAAIKAGVSAYVVEDIDAGRLSAVGWVEKQNPSH